MVSFESLGDQSRDRRWREIIDAEDQLVAVVKAFGATLAAMDRRLQDHHSTARARAEQLMAELDVAQVRMFSEFLEAKAPIERELREATRIDGKAMGVNGTRLLAAISAARDQVGAQTLVGESALAAADALGINCAATGGPCRENPWANLVRDPAPWEAAFMSAVNIYKDGLPWVNSAHCGKSYAFDHNGQEEAGPEKFASVFRERGIIVRIVGARGLRDADDGPDEADTSDPYCTCQVEGPHYAKKTTSVMHDTEAPVWNHEMRFDKFRLADTLVFKVHDFDPGMNDAFLGTTFLTGAQALSGFHGELLLSQAGYHQEAYLEVHTKAVPT